MQNIYRCYNANNRLKDLENVSITVDFSINTMKCIIIIYLKIRITYKAKYYETVAGCNSLKMDWLVGLWCLTPLSTLLMEETTVLGENQ